ncbi:hypothetical protein [Brevundimonas aurantiaca]|jgi:hypothetical protein|uniref:Morphogenetic protein n=1 Tax=Brevundimonas aurantiaca TaxID=74316 RepID=A0A7W9F9G1_9CAUL|nr:hypothetical protein [Brevundimonas aurantiaca]MBB5741072.1 hypothetical protein [Brevundimonas aurantiaca]
MTAPKERPILFSGPMVRALLDGTKAQTRRVVKSRALEWLADAGFGPGFVADPANGLCPYSAPGDRLWVREMHAIVPRTAYAMSEGVQQTLKPGDDHDAAVYAAAWERSRPGRWRPSIHMPRWASRLTLEITEVRVERLQDISEADAMAEGASPCANGVWFDGKPEFAGCDARGAYYSLWEHINGAGSWDANPWVWAVSFRVLERA